jgi:Na+-translocating ferredoxin:NAD+ oxidoreductase RnfG subunit
MHISGKNRKILSAILIAILFTLICSNYSCRGSKGTRRAYKVQKEAVKANNKEHDEILKTHYERQSVETKQMMKEMQKENKKIKKNKKRSFWDRLFNRKCR